MYHFHCNYNDHVDLRMTTKMKVSEAKWWQDDEVHESIVEVHVPPRSLDEDPSLPWVSLLLINGDKNWKEYFGKKWYYWIPILLLHNTLALSHSLLPFCILRIVNWGQMGGQSAHSPVLLIVPPKRAVKCQCEAWWQHILQPTFPSSFLLSSQSLHSFLVLPFYLPSTHFWLLIIIIIMIITLITYSKTLTKKNNREVVVTKD